MLIVCLVGRNLLLKFGCGYVDFSEKLFWLFIGVNVIDFVLVSGRLMLNGMIVVLVFVFVSVVRLMFVCMFWCRFLSCVFCLMLICLLLMCRLGCVFSLCRLLMLSVMIVLLILKFMWLLVCGSFFRFGSGSVFVIWLLSLYMSVLWMLW